jgi:hypothetical protein
MAGYMRWSLRQRTFDKLHYVKSTCDNLKFRVHTKELQEPKALLRSFLYLTFNEFTRENSH